MNFKEKFKNIIKELDSLEINNDFKHEELWKKEVQVVTEDINETINYLKTECTKDEFVWLSEIFSDVMQVVPSKEFIDELYVMAKKYPDVTKEYNIMSFIDEASQYLK